MFKQTIVAVLMAIALLAFAGSATEIRGSVYSTNDGTYSWDSNSFSAFYYNVDNDDAIGETMTAVVTGKTIKENNLKYTTRGVRVEKTDGRVYTVVGWMGEDWIGVGDKTNKIAKLIYNMADDDKATLITGNVLNLGSGYILTINEVDAKASPRQAWVTLKRDGKVLDDGIVGQKEVYEYKTTVLGDEDTLVFRIYVDSIFSGVNSDMIQLKYGWLIDQNTAKEIKASDRFGSMEVTQVSDKLVTLTNDNSISLNKDSEVTFMGNMKFKVSKLGGKFYPKIDVVNNVATILPTVTAKEVVPIVTVTATPTVTNTVSPAAPLVTPTPQIITKTVEVPVKETDYTVSGIIGIVTLILGYFGGKYRKN